MTTDTGTQTWSRGVRVDVQGLVFVEIPSKSTFLLNVSEGGMAVQAMEILCPGECLRFSFPLPGTEAKIKGVARIAWSDCSGRAGMKIVEIGSAERRRLCEWLRTIPEGRAAYTA